MNSRSDGADHTMKCILCGSADVSDFTKSPHILTCGSCRSSFRDPSPVMIDYSRKIAMPDRLSAELRNRHHYDFIKKHVGFPNIRSILEIGSGDGTLIRYIRSRHKDMVITAIEPGSQLCRKLRRIENVTVINGYIEKVRLSRKFDLVIMSHVLEHLVDPVQTLRYAYDTFLKKGGVLYIDVPTRDYELRSADAAAVAPESHLVFFDGQGLKQVLALIGFAENRIEGAKYSSLPPSFIHRMEKIGRMKGSNKRGVSLFIYKLMNKASLLVLNAYRTAFSVTPEEIGLDETDYRYNNMAIAARK